MRNLPKYFLAFQVAYGLKPYAPYLCFDDRQQKSYFEIYIHNTQALVLVNITNQY